MKYAYYPGCSLHSTAKEYDKSLRAVCEDIGIELDEVKDWVCCGSSWAHPTSKLLDVALPMQNLSEIEKSGHSEVIVPCAECFSRFKAAQHEVKNDRGLAAEIEKIVEYKFKGEVKVTHPLEIMASNDLLSKIANSVKRDVSGIKAVSYYGCLLVRPPKVTEFADDYEYPQSMDKILKAIGISTIDWAGKTDCCGASFALTRTDIVLKLSNELLKAAKSAGADAIVVACPMCQSNLDTRQEEIEKQFNTTYHIPIVYFTQLMGLAFDKPADKLSIGSLLIDADNLLEKVK